MHGGGKSDEAIVAVKPANAAEQSAAELVEPRAEAKGNAARQSTYRTQRRVDVSPAPDRIRHRARGVSFGPEVGAVCGKAARTVLCGGRSAMSVPTATRPLRAVRTRSERADGAHAALCAPYELNKAPARRGALLGRHLIQISDSPPRSRDAGAPEACGTSPLKEARGAE